MIDLATLHIQLGGLGGEESHHREHLQAPPLRGET
jgi:hypothetical protein